MREILFRGKRLMDGEWVYGSFIPDATEVRGLKIEMPGFIINYDFVHESGYKVHGYEVDRETVGQFTGLTDKNGKKIFEGDIVRYYHGVQKPIYDEETGVVSGYKASRIIRYKGYVTINELGVEINLSNNCQWWRHKNGNQLARVEVIGNVHDNPELLKGE